MLSVSLIVNSVNFTTIWAWGLLFLLKSWVEVVGLRRTCERERFVGGGHGERQYACPPTPPGGVPLMSSLITTATSFSQKGCSLAVWSRKSLKKKKREKKPFWLKLLFHTCIYCVFIHYIYKYIYAHFELWGLNSWPEWKLFRALPVLGGTRGMYVQQTRMWSRSQGDLGQESGFVAAVPAESCSSHLNGRTQF